ncbi:MAG: glycosidase [Cohnella sp.]|nr:glycosidase [Cohnella sp.]
MVSPYGLFPLHLFVHLPVICRGYAIYFVKKVVFSCGARLVSDTIRMYYGAADEVMALADIPLQDIFDTMVYEQDRLLKT